MKFVNTDTQERVWPGLKAGDGSTLRLGPGESADLELTAGFDDSYLKPAKKESKAQREKREGDEGDAEEKARLVREQEEAEDAAAGGDNHEESLL